MKKGFTLIELLAVIVILAIIALIAVPIVLDIIKDSKKSSLLRSAEFYVDGLKTAIATSTLHNKQIKDGTYYIMKDGNVCLGIYDDKDNECDGDILEIQIKGEKPDDGIITIKDGQIVSHVIKYGDFIVKNEGNTNHGIIPEGAIYISDNDHILRAGDSFPLSKLNGDVYIYNGHSYTLKNREEQGHGFDTLGDARYSLKIDVEKEEGMSWSEFLTKLNMTEAEVWLKTGFTEDAFVPASGGEWVVRTPDTASILKSINGLPVVSILADKIPEGGVYYIGGLENPPVYVFPEKAEIGDVYAYNSYEYVYKFDQHEFINYWHVETTDRNADLLDTINGERVWVKTRYIIPEGGVYTGGGTVYKVGELFPYNPFSGDTYTYNGYTYECEYYDVSLSYYWTIKVHGEGEPLYKIGGYPVLDQIY